MAERCAGCTFLEPEDVRINAAELRRGMVQIDLRVCHLKIDMNLGVGLVQYAELVLDDIECVHEKSSIICDTESFSERKLPENCAGWSPTTILYHKTGEKSKEVLNKFY